MIYTPYSFPFFLLLHKRALQVQKLASWRNWRTTCGEKKPFLHRPGTVWFYEFLDMGSDLFLFSSSSLLSSPSLLTLLLSSLSFYTMHWVLELLSGTDGGCILFIRSRVSHIEEFSFVDNILLQLGGLMIYLAWAFTYTCVLCFSLLSSPSRDAPGRQRAQRDRKSVV